MLLKPPWRNQHQSQKGLCSWWSLLRRSPLGNVMERLYPATVRTSCPKGEPALQPEWNEPEAWQRPCRVIETLRRQRHQHSNSESWGWWGARDTLRDSPGCQVRNHSPDNKPAAKTWYKLAKSILRKRKMEK